MRLCLVRILGSLFVLAAASQCALYEDVSPPPRDTTPNPPPDTDTRDTRTPDRGDGDAGCVATDAPGTGEPCNGRDDDCDGVVDEQCSCDFDGSSEGVCGEASRGPNGTCVTPAHWQSDESACDGRDNDCDGTVDEGCLCNYAGRTAGICQNQRVDENGECPEPAEFEQQESSCDDRVDNDCDDEIDERDGDCRRPAGTACSTEHQCLSGFCIEGTCAHRLFVTSEKTDGDLSGLDGADTFCNDAAANADLGGRWRAVLSVAGSPARERLEIAGPIVNSNGETFADGADDLWDSDHPSRAAFDEYGNEIDASVWTGTTFKGKIGEDRCDDWTTNDSSTKGIIGWSRKSNNAWIHAGGFATSCADSLHLYCIDGQ